MDGHGPRIRRLAWLVVALVLLAGCSNGAKTTSPSTTTSPTTTTSAPTTTAPPVTAAPPTTVVLPPIVAGLGDSQLFEAEDDLVALFPDARVVFHTVPGLTLDEGHFGLAALESLDPSAFGVVLGTNNVLDGSATEDLATLIAFADLLGTEGCVKWLDLPTTTPDPRFNAAADVLNHQLGEVSAVHQTIEIVGWSSEVAAHPEWFRDDLIHFTAAGQKALAATLASALRRCPSLRGLPLPPASMTPTTPPTPSSTPPAA